MRGIALALVALPLPVVASGCGAVRQLDADDVAAIAADTAATGGFRIEAVGEFGGDRFIVTGLIDDYDEPRASFSYEVESDDRTLDGYRGKVTVVGTVVYAGSALYDLEPADPNQEPTLWVLGDTADERPSLDELIAPFPFFDPSRVLDLLPRMSGDPERVADEDVRGVPTARYRMTLDLERVIEAAPAENRAALRQELAKESSKTRPFELWLDDDGLARRIRIRDDEDRPVTVEFFDFGVEVDIQAPPKAKVESFDDIFMGGEDVP